MTGGVKSGDGGIALSFREKTTASGLRVLVEENTAARSVAVGFFVATGSRDEPAELAGVSHFLEHMSFKTTRRRSAIEVSRALDEMGSRANAYTSWERTAYYAQILPEFAPQAMDLIAEMIDPAFLPEDFDTERKVILEEIEMYNDRPEFLLFEELMEKRYAPHSLGGSILGSRASIEGMTLDGMRAYHASRYRGSNIILAIAGGVRADDVFQWAERLTGLGAPATSAAPVGGHVPVTATGRGDVIVKRPQDAREHYLAAWTGPTVPALRERYVASVLGVLLGDEEGSRFAWALTHPGITESVEAGGISFRDDGMLYAGFSCVPETFERAREILHVEISRLRKDGCAADELDRAKTKHASRTMLAAESTMGRMSGLGVDALDGIPYHTLEEECRIILSITADEVMTWAERMTEPEVTARIGPI
jgi:predicted Zn-dependent peptidase